MIENVFFTSQAFQQEKKGAFARTEANFIKKQDGAGHEVAASRGGEIIESKRKSRAEEGLNLQIVATHYQASFPYLEGAVGTTAGASLLTARACKRSCRLHELTGSSDGFTERTSDASDEVSAEKAGPLCAPPFIHTE